MFKLVKTITLTGGEQISVFLGYQHHKELIALERRVKSGKEHPNNLVVAKSLMRKQLRYGVKFKVLDDGNTIVFYQFKWGLVRYE